ncbi:MAG: hypothetical protein EAZ40_11640, partial [Rhodobacterales bacterium]
MLIRSLDPSEAPLVAALYRDAPDYWLLAEGTVDPDRQAVEFFTDGPPGRDPALTHHLGLFLEGRLSGVAEVSYGFPDPLDAYLGLILTRRAPDEKSLIPFLFHKCSNKCIHDPIPRNNRSHGFSVFLQSIETCHKLLFQRIQALKHPVVEELLT